ncbi:MAG: hypothetical protein ACR2G6_17790 [Gemmatimonadaceae bacterium]
MHASTEEEIQQWAMTIDHLLRATDAGEIWLPLGVGSHTDHELARNACLFALSGLDGLERRARVFLYQDVPYAGQFSGHTSAIVDALTAAGASLEPRHDDIAASLRDKQRLVSVFASQFKASYMAPRIEDAARHASPSGEGHFELRFWLKSLPLPVDPLAVYSGRAAVHSLVPRVFS